VSTNTVTWFQIGTPNGSAAEQFYGELFGWRFEADPDLTIDYRMIVVPGKGPMGGILDHHGEGQNHAVFCVEVDDVDATSRRVAELGGKVAAGPIVTNDGLSFAHVLDQDGNEFMVWKPPAA
jgi:uncharacterized protein